MDNHYQLAIIGGGPAGLTAATTAAEYDVQVALFDEQPEPGGQIYRATESIPDHRSSQLGEEYQRGRNLVNAFRHSKTDYFPGTQIWSLNRQREIGLLRRGQARIITADQILVANGAMERPVPFPGWSLPGVMYAGAGQILFKSAGAIPADGVVLAGSGPLLLLLAWQYVHAGVPVKAVLDTTPVSNYLRAMPQLPRALLAWHYLSKGLTYNMDLKRAGVPVHYGVKNIRAYGEDNLQSIKYRQLGREHTIETDLLMTHFGVIPHIWLAQSAGCVLEWSPDQQSWHPEHDEWGNSSIEGILIAGDGGGINGARCAEHAGRLSALQMLNILGKISRKQRDELAADERKHMLKDRHIRPFLETLYRIPLQDQLATPDDETIVCRCEEISAGQIRQAVTKGHGDSNQVKFLTRCGMGPCQGRQCANAVAHIIANVTNEAVPKPGPYRARPPVTPLTLGQLAGLKQEPVE